jgi:DNA-binding XRE family transcriptional regulator
VGFDSMAKSEKRETPTVKLPAATRKHAAATKSTSPTPEADQGQKAARSPTRSSKPPVAAKPRAKASTQDTNHNQGEPVSADLQVAVGANLRAARLAAGLTLRQVAELTGITFQYLGKVEKGGKNLTLSTMETLAAVLHVRINDLLPKRPP